MAKKEKTYRVSSKIYFNDRLKPVMYNGKHSYPLYIQVTFNRKSIFFKSFYFDLFLQPRFIINTTGTNTLLNIEQIIQLEENLVTYIISKRKEEFSLEVFKKDYSFYGRDLCAISEPEFVDFIYNFINDKGMPDFAIAIREGMKLRAPFDVIDDLKIALKSNLYDELLENSYSLAPIYLPLSGFVRDTKKWPMLFITVYEWQNPENKTKFAEYLQKHFPNRNPELLINRIDSWITTNI